MKYRCILAALGAIGSVTAVAIPQYGSNQQCEPIASGEIVVYDIIIVNEPIIIETWVPQPTQITTKGATITVHDPTYLSTTVTVTSTSTVTKTVATATVATATVHSSTTVGNSSRKPSTKSSSSKSSSKAFGSSKSSGIASGSSKSSGKASGKATATVSVDTSAAGKGFNTGLNTATSTYSHRGSASVKTYTSHANHTTALVYSTSTVAPAATSIAAGEYTNWNTFKANGVNLGNWLEIEESNDQYFWDTYVNGTEVTDEWTFCETLGSECGPILEEHYSTYITTDTIDKLASVGVNFLRIPTTYAAWVVVPGSQLYHGSQQTYLRTICEYAIATHGMRVVVGLHSLPGGVNSLDIGEASGHDDWFFNQTNLDYSYQAISAVLEFIEASSNPWAYTVGVINEAADNPSGFATAAGMTQNGTDYIVDYTKTVMDMISNSTTPKVPTMLQDCFLGEEHWSPYFNTTDNLVIDTHIYYFAAAGVYSGYATGAICGQASAAPGDGKFPVFIGEWSLQTLYNNTLENRETLFNTQRYAWEHYVQGGAFWGAVFNGSAAVDGEGTQRDYWSYTRLIDAGVINTMTNQTYC